MVFGMCAARYCAIELEWCKLFVIDRIDAIGY